MLTGLEARVAELQVYASSLKRESMENRQRIAKLETALCAILSIRDTSDPGGDAKAMRGIAREAMGGAASVGPQLRTAT